MQKSSAKRNADSYVSMYDSGAVVYTGPDAIKLLRAKTIYSALGLLKVGLRPNRMYRPKTVFAIATEYTGKKYKKGQYDVARADLKIWIDNAMISMKIERKD